MLPCNYFLTFLPSKQCKSYGKIFMLYNWVIPELIATKLSNVCLILDNVQIMSLFLLEMIILINPENFLWNSQIDYPQEFSLLFHFKQTRKKRNVNAKLCGIIETFQLLSKKKLNGCRTKNLRILRRFLETVQALFIFLQASYFYICLCSALLQRF